MKEEPPAKCRRRFGKFYWWVLAIFLAGCGYTAWREYDYRAAVREAKQAGFQWASEDPLTLIQEDWHNALKKETWGMHERQIVLGKVLEFGRYHRLLRRLRPTQLQADECKDENLIVLSELKELKWLCLNCPSLNNIDALKELRGLNVLNLSGCSSLQNVDALKSLTALQSLDLILCNKIPAAALRELRAALPNTDITFPDGSKNPPQ